MCINFIWNQKTIWKEHSKVLLPVYSTSMAFFSSSSCTSAINIASWLGSQSNVGWIHLFCFGVRQCCFMNSVLWNLMLSSSEGKTSPPSTASFQNHWWYPLKLENVFWRFANTLLCYKIGFMFWVFTACPQSSLQFYIDDSLLFQVFNLQFHLLLKTCLDMGSQWLRGL